MGAHGTELGQGPGASALRVEETTGSEDSGFRLSRRLQKHHLFQAPSTLPRSQILRRKRLIGFSAESRKQCGPAPPRPHAPGSNDPRREEGVALHISDTSLKRDTHRDRDREKETERDTNETETERQG